MAGVERHDARLDRQSGMGAPQRTPLPSIDQLFRTALILVPIGVVGNLIFALIATDGDVLAALATYPRRYLLLAALLGLAPWIFGTCRLLLWTQFVGLRLTVLEAFRITLWTDLGAAVSPTALGGGVFKWGLLVQRGLRPGAAASVTTLPTLEDALFVAIALPVLVVISEPWNLPVVADVITRMRGNAIEALAIWAAVAALAWLAARFVMAGGLGRRARLGSQHLLGLVGDALRRAWADGRDVFSLVAGRGKRRLAVSFALTALQWSCRYSVLLALIGFLGVRIDVPLLLVLQWVVFSVATLVPTPGATGGAEAAFFLTFGSVLPDAVIGVATAGWRFLTFYLQTGLAAGLTMAFGLRERRGGG